MSSHGSDIHFLKKIEEDTLRNGELRIPRSFVNKCWEGISNPVLLQLPNGDKWYVQWKKLDADVWLIDDWKKFAGSYSLDQDHLLLFKYVGKSLFKVVILDQSGLEMEYRLMEGTSDGEENGGFLSQSKRAKSPLSLSPSTNKVKTNPRKEPTSYPTQDVETRRSQSRRTNAKLKNRDGRKIMHANRRYSKSKAIQSEVQGALERAVVFCSQSDNRTFLREMKPSYIKRSVLAMPRDFVTEPQRKDGDSVTLGTFEDKIWVVNVCRNHGNGQITLTGGWKNFAKENNLKIRDVCVFEQIKSRGFSYGVHIFRYGEESNPSMFPAYEDDGTSRRNQRGLQAKKGSDGIPKKQRGKSVFEDSGIPRLNNEMPANLLTLSLKPNPLNDESTLLELMRNDEIDNRNDVTLQIGERSWPVKLVWI